MKKSILLLIIWAAFSVVLTGVYMALMMNPTPDRDTVTSQIGWALLLFTAVFSVVMMLAVRKQAKTEQTTWLAVVSKVLLIFYSAVGTAGLLMYILLRLFA